MNTINSIIKTQILFLSNTFKKQYICLIINKLNTINSKIKYIPKIVILSNSKNRFLPLLTMCFMADIFPQKPLTKEELTKLYYQYYATKSDIALEISKQQKQDCEVRLLADTVYRQVENRINFFRLANRLPMIKMNASSHTKTQKAAIMMDANHALSHAPDKKWKCYSEEGAQTASKSCLGLTQPEHYKNTAFVSHFIQDFGDQNYYCGHRRWLLYSKSKEMAYGSTGIAEVILVADGVDFNTPTKDLPNFVAYPWPGYVPANLIFTKWSFSIPEQENQTVDFSKCNIKVSCDGKILNIKKFEELKNFLDPSITWKIPELVDDRQEEKAEEVLQTKGYIGKEMKVEIANVKINGKMEHFKYSILITSMNN